VLEKYKEAIRDKRIIHWEETTEYPSGVIVGEVAVAPVFDEDGNCTHLIGSVHEITERKKAEEHILRYQQRLKKMATELTLTEERQRKAIASDLHDHVGQLISSSRLELAAIHDGMEKTDILSKLTSISKTLQEGIQATRTAIFNLSFPQLNEMGLFAAISDWLYEQIELKHGIKTLLTGPDQKYNLNETTRLLVFRSIRELLNNVLKHARATQVNVNIKSKATTLEITIRDDGVGFDLDSIGKRSGISGLGLFSIKERMEDIGGSISIQSKEGMGTKIILLVALANDN
jgi:signal transduction histidine kinase